MGISRDHHYIPQFFIKEFADDKGRVFLYNKKERKFQENKDTPDVYLKETFKLEKVFYIKDMNNISLSGNKSGRKKYIDCIEKFLTEEFDTPFSNTFQDILENFERFLEDEKRVFEMSKNGNERLYDEQIFKDHYEKRLAVSCFIAKLFCRNPHNFALIESYLQSHPKKLDFTYVAKGGCPMQVKKANEYIHTQIYNDVPAFQKIDVITKSYFEIFDIQHINSDWRILSGKKENNLGILGDIPIIYRDFSKLQSFAELAVPVSKDKLLIYGKNLTIKEEEKTGGCGLYEKLAVFAMAKEFIIGSNKECIESVANLYYRFIDSYGEDKARSFLIDRFFDCFEEKNNI